MKIWYIEIHGNKEGPYSVEDLKADPRLTPDTLAWKNGFATWVPIRHIPELKEVFSDQEETTETEEEESKKESLLSNKQPSDELAIDWRADPPQFFLIILIVLIVLLFVLYQFSAHR